MGILSSFFDMTMKDVVTLFVAAYGAILSSVVFLRSVGKDKKKIKIYLTGENGSLECNVVNVGHRPVMVNLPKIRLPNSKLMDVYPVRGSFADFPKQLSEEENVELKSDPQSIKRDLVEGEGYSGAVILQAVCTDTTGKRYKGSKIRFTIRT